MIRVSLEASFTAIDSEEFLSKNAPFYIPNYLAMLVATVS